jgi:acyl carrier protein
MTNVSGRTALETAPPRSATPLHEVLAGFPAITVNLVLRFKLTGARADLDAAMRSLLEFYLPARNAQSLTTAPLETRLREDLGLDSLTLTEAAFKLDEVFDIETEIREVAAVSTLGDMLEFMHAKTGANS